MALFNQYSLTAIHLAPFRAISSRIRYRTPGSIAESFEAGNAGVRIFL